MPLPFATRSLPLRPLPDYKPAFVPRPLLPFPYTNLIYLSASGEAERARDLQDETLDGQAHGALTNMLLLGLRGDADTNHDGAITYRELYQFVEREVSQRYGHTPQLQTRADLERPVFDVAPRRTPPAPSLPLAQGPVRVKLENTVPAALHGTLAGLTGVRLTEGAYEVLVTPEGTGYALSLANGDALCRLDSAAQVATRLARYASVRALLHLHNPQQRFNVHVQVGDSPGRTVFTDGERLSFTLESERVATLLLINVDPQGDVQAITSAMAAGGRLTLPNAGLVEAPFGTEYMKVFALPEAPPGLERWSNRRLGALGSEAPELLRWLQNAGDWAETLREVVTVPRP
jgi:hypothetical protein